jgi:hypothetical protein
LPLGNRYSHRVTRHNWRAKRSPRN